MFDGRKEDEDAVSRDSTWLSVYCLEQFSSGLELANAIPQNKIFLVSQSHLS